MDDLLNARAGERCFILGNGPSLNETDLSRLRGEATFGLNRIYLKFPNMGYPTSYLVCVNPLVIDQCVEEICDCASLKFLSFVARDRVKMSDDVILLRSRCGPKFFSDIRRGIWEGSTVTYVAMQIAYFLGFQKVILVGVDHSFQTKGEPHKVVTSQGKDPNHFDPDYFGKGFRWQLPDLVTSELAYRIAKHSFEADGREIVDATMGGELEVFRKVEYDSLF